MDEQRREGNAGAGPASRDEIIGILGPLDEVLLIDIQRTGASAADVLEAFTRLQEDDAVGRAARRGAEATVTAVMAILEAAELKPERD
ncbi:hypothetical protein DFH01_20555 [Falsiroseomonas bella]|uniref:Uncharacterized protein n=1 Tax=Falsiroseomonas bella TaxID=2184016 RepID=A0A317FBS9_9PROT|nr:hypothetical protein [Falsiroseomonas bella]PWS35953.1 hypothetical protein DFH01_20555 [Falsiroseomonas bella]